MAEPQFSVSVKVAKRFTSGSWWEQVDWYTTLPEAEERLARLREQFPDRQYRIMEIDGMNKARVLDI